MSKPKLTFEELFLWAMDNQIGIQIYTRPVLLYEKQDKDNQTYHARFAGNIPDEVHQEVVGFTPEDLMNCLGFSLQKIYVNMTMKKPRKRK